MNLIFHALEHAFEDSLPMLPFLFLAYLLIEWIERHHGDAIERALAGGGRWGFVPGAVLGCVPQCGFSALAANLYASRVITPGTLLAVFVATSDEALPLLAAAPGVWNTLPVLLGAKVAAGVAAGVAGGGTLRVDATRSCEELLIELLGQVCGAFVTTCILVVHSFRFLVYLLS